MINASVRPAFVAADSTEALSQKSIGFEIYYYSGSAA
jgi:hypothetical protein